MMLKVNEIVLDIQKIRDNLEILSQDPDLKVSDLAKDSLGHLDNIAWKLQDFLETSGDI